MNKVKVEVPIDGGKNLTLQVTGRLVEEVGKPQLLYTSAGRLRIDSVLWAIQEKCGLGLWWSSEDLLIPLESRGAYSFVSPIVAPKQWDYKLYYTCWKVDEPKLFYLTLDCEKLV